MSELLSTVDWAGVANGILVVLAMLGAKGPLGRIEAAIAGLQDGVARVQRRVTFLEDAVLSSPQLTNGSGIHRDDETPTVNGHG